MRKQGNRPNQSTRKQLFQELSVELFSKDDQKIKNKNCRKTLNLVPSSSSSCSQLKTSQISISKNSKKEEKKQKLADSKGADNSSVNNNDQENREEPSDLDRSNIDLVENHQSNNDEARNEKASIETLNDQSEISETNSGMNSHQTISTLQSAQFGASSAAQFEHAQLSNVDFNPPPPPPSPSPSSSSSPIASNHKMWNSRWEQFSEGMYSKYSSSASPFNKKNVEKLPNPFANRKKFPIENFEQVSTIKKSFDSKDICEEFSQMNLIPPSTARNLKAENTTVLLPTWWKSRSFSSASCYYPQNVKSQVCRNMSLNVPNHGNLNDIDSFVSIPSNHNRKADLIARKEKWARIKAKKRMLRRPVEEEFFEDADEEEEIMCGRGVMLNPIIQQNGSEQYEEADLLRKYRRDVSFIKEQILKEVDGNIDMIRELRFLIASVQTYGNIDNQCMMAEISMNEFTLFSGVLERFHAIVGPWSAENETQRRRASRHAFETHKIPLQHNFATISKRKLVEEILGRSEPSVAYRQGVKVGLYNDNCDEQFRVHLHIKNGFKDNAMVVDSNERRFILVLQSEIELMIESMKYLATTVGLQYDGFPTTPDRFVIAEAFVDAISELLGETPTPETMRWFGLFGQKNNAQNDNTTPWEKNVELYCSRHSEPKNNFCAQVIVCRVTFIILHILGSFFRRYHLRKIPSSSINSSSFSANLNSLPNTIISNGKFCK